MTPGGVVVIAKVDGMSTDPRPVLKLAFDQTHAALAAVRPEQLTQPTPCRSWTVSALVGHIVHDLDAFLQQARGERADWGAPAPALTDGWADAFRTKADQVMDAWWAAGDLSGTITLPIGEAPATTPVYQAITEFAVHSWDVARATGHDTELSPEVAEAALSWAPSMLRPEFRGSESDGMAFGPEKPVSDAAPVYERLAGFFGRDPQWTPPHVP